MKLQDQNYTKNLWDMNYFEKFKNLMKEKFGISIAEWHSIAFGSGLAIIGGLPLASVVTAYLFTNDGLKGHLKDTKKEIGYFVGSFLTVEMIQQIFILLI